MDKIAARLVEWLDVHAIQTLNVAGPRESKRPGIYDLTRTLLEAIAPPTQISSAAWIIGPLTETFMHADHLEDPLQWNTTESTQGDLTVNARAYQLGNSAYFGGQWRITNTQNGRPLKKMLDEPFADAKAAKLNALNQAIQIVASHQQGKRNPKLEILYGPVAIL